MPGPVLGWVAGLGFLAGGPRVAGPGSEPFPQRGDLVLAEPYLSEHPVVHLVQRYPGIGEILAGQTRIQPPGKADQLGRAVAFQHGGHVRVVPRLDAAGFSELTSRRPPEPGLHRFTRCQQRLFRTAPEAQDGEL